MLTCTCNTFMIDIQTIETLWWHISAINCQKIMSTCQIFMLTCQLFMSICQIIIMSTCQIIMSTCQIIVCYLYGINWARTRKISLHSLADLEGALGRTPPPPLPKIFKD